MKAAALFLVALLLPAVLGLHMEEFNAFLNKYNKKYTGIEYHRRLQIFERNLKLAEQHQRDDPTAEHGVTKFFDMTYEEFQKTMLTEAMPGQFLAKNCLKQGIFKPHPDRAPQDLPDSFDWRDHPGVVTAVQDQGSCGSCWAFSTAGTVEGCAAVAGNAPGPMSAQWSVDCSKNCSSEIYYGSNITVCNQGCSGGWPWTAMWDIIDHGGLPTLNDYPYRGVDQQCKGNNFADVVKIVDYYCISGPDFATNDGMKQSIMTYGPLSIAVNANYFFSYSHGISDPSGCPTEYLNHAILLVGWGVENGKNYWIVKNSWGAGWGESGYIRMAMHDPSDQAGSCGINEGVCAPKLA